MVTRQASGMGWFINRQTGATYIQYEDTNYMELKANGPHSAIIYRRFDIPDSKEVSVRADVWKYSLKSSDVRI